MPFSGRAFRGLMFRAIGQGFSFNSFYRSTRERGISYRRTDMLQDWRDVVNEVVGMKLLKGVASDVIPPHTDLVESKIHYSSPFVYKARVDVTVKETGIQTERFVTVLSEKALTLGEVEEQINRKWPGYEYGRSERLTHIETTAALHYIS